ncbi:enoyl-CoA hydratase/isomerase family protein [Amycolatopsis sp. EV170708-02-1]|uniref:enoyl-CoA hydratase/isomerase family protein n=1 Tax=Amycolatopsis sp. EV170708-02-1 TaxID=2919322 RepID=UPI001F0CD3A8|nr:enoyl-CoA hydratase/isomerase family protein [Amycolatopsis sp. EV170708-02-1]UMP00760.1 enoyl-CoA hydratase/isomerase family protein [Amycolatopsis sp. EV170708-02-1]
MTRVLVTRRDQVTHLSLNRPDRLNVLDPAVYAELFAALDAAYADPEVRAIVLSGAGEHFCAGFDLGASDDMAAREPVWAQWEGMTSQRAAMAAIGDSPKPIVAAVRGYCLGGGFELANYCDFIVAAEDTVFGEPEVRFSLVAHPRLLYFVPLRKAKEIQLLGETFGAADAERLGLVNEVVPAEELEDRAMAFARRLSRVPAETFRHTKTIMSRVLEMQGMGVVESMIASDFVVSKLTETADRARFREIRETQGLRAALAWSRAKDGAGAEAPRPSVTR